MTLLQSGITKSLAEDYEIDNSCRFNNDAYLARTPSVAGNQKTFTFSGWFKKITADDGSTSMFLTSVADSDNRFYFGSPVSDIVYIYGQTGSGANQIYLATNALYRDPASWYHYVMTVDTTHATSSERVRLYVNGERVTSFSTETYPAQDYECKINTTTAMYVGAYGPSGVGNYMNGYMAEVYWVDGQALDADSFGELDSTTNQWIPLDSDDVKDAVTFGTNGFYQKYNSTELAASFADSAETDIVAFTANDTWTVPTGITAVDVLVVGGGGSVGADSVSNAGGGGGGAGGLVY